MADFPMPPAWVVEKLRAGLVIPAHPLSLTEQRKLDERRQRALTRYYHAAGAGGIAVGVHTTQFEIREPQHRLFKPVLQLAAETIAACDQGSRRQTVRMAGICGQTAQAVAEACFAREAGYHAGLLSLSAFRQADDDTLIEHCRTVAREIPLVGFYLQPAAGGRSLSFNFWRRFVEIPNVVAIKIAPFNRYQTLDVVRAVAEAGRAGDIALYTGNDDSIVTDLLTEYGLATAPPTGSAGFQPASRKVRLRIVGGLLGHWACWTHTAVKLLADCQATWNSDSVPAELLTRAAQVTDCNAAFFDAANGFAGCVPGIHEVLRRQGLMANTLCLDPREQLSPGQREEIDRVWRAYPFLNDDEFVQRNLERWLI
jgi:dihydrodipicolinate synthase/N-acetylneuraminate lyase